MLGDIFSTKAIVYYVTPQPIELDDELIWLLEGHLGEDETVEEFIEELVSIYEQEERFSDSGL